MGELLLTGEGLSKSYGGVIALSDVSLKLHGGEVLGLVGPNGAGKTTLVDLISGAQPATSGTLSLRGTPLSGSAARRARAGLARTFQHPQLAADLSMLENISLGRTARRHGTVAQMVGSAVGGVIRPFRTDEARAAGDIATELGLSGLDRLAGDLTLGEQRLVEVGRALAQDPLVLLLDEPFAGADVTGVAGISEVVRTVRERGHGVILVDHNVDLVCALADRIMLLAEGKVVFDGDPAECLSSSEMQRVYFGLAGAQDGD